MAREQNDTDHNVTVHFNGSTGSYSVVTNQQASTPQATPVATMIFYDPITREKEEGLAILHEPDLRGCDDEWWEGHVEFVDKPGHRYFRRVYLK